MHRPLFIAAFVLLLASIPLMAQHGGGHSSGGGHGGFSAHGSFGGHVGGGHAFGGMRSGSGFTSRSFGPRSSFHPPLSSSRGFNRSGIGLRIRTRGFRNNCFGRGCGLGYGYPWYGGFDPYWWWDSGSSDDPDPDQQYQTGLANQMNQQSLDEQRMQRLDEQRMREQSDQDLYARSAPPRPRMEQSSTALPSTVLVFRDQRKQEVQNYAIVGQTLWIFAPERTQKVPLAEVDIDATQKANDERGVDFRLPGTPEGQ
jgi:hypothetical protein